MDLQEKTRHCTIHQTVLYNLHHHIICPSNTIISSIKYSHPHNQQVIIQQESSSHYQVKITNRIIIIIIVNI